VHHDQIGGENLRGENQSEINTLEQERPKNQEKNTLPCQLLHFITFASTNSVLKSRHGGSWNPRAPCKTRTRHSGAKISHFFMRSLLFTLCSGLCQRASWWSCKKEISTLNTTEESKALLDWVLCAKCSTWSQIPWNMRSWREKKPAHKERAETERERRCALGSFLCGKKVVRTFSRPTSHVDEICSKVKRVGLTPACQSANWR